MESQPELFRQSMYRDCALRFRDRGLRCVWLGVLVFRGSHSQDDRVSFSTHSPGTGVHKYQTRFKGCLM